jgi:hypothetical protein
MILNIIGRQTLFIDLVSKTLSSQQILCTTHLGDFEDK